MQYIGQDDRFASVLRQELGEDAFAELFEQYALLQGFGNACDHERSHAHKHDRTVSPIIEAHPTGDVMGDKPQHGDDHNRERDSGWLYNGGFFDTLYDLLHVQTGAKQIGTTYGSARTPITREQFRAAGRGEVAYALCTVIDGRALFGGIDLDDDFQARLPYLRRAIYEIGGAMLANSCFITEGSQPGRGKIVITTSKPVAQDTLRALVHSVFDIARGMDGFAPFKRKSDYDLRPQDKSGGLCRVLGRNVGKDGPLERACFLDGEIIGDEHDLAKLMPVDEAFLRTLVPSPAPLLQPWAQKRISTSLTWEMGDHRWLFGWMLGLAREIGRAYGFGEEGERQCKTAFEHIASISPKLNEPSKKTGDTRNPLLWSRYGKNAWNEAVKKPVTWTRRNVNIDGIPRGVQRCYTALADHADDNGLHHDFFTCSGRQMAELFGLKDHKHARADFLRTVELGYAVLYDNGTQGENGQPSLIGIVGEDETAEMLIADNQNEPMLVARKAAKQTRSAIHEAMRARGFKRVRRTCDIADWPRGWAGVGDYVWVRA